MAAGDYGVAPIPFEDPVPPGGKHVNSMVAGINLAVFANTRHKEAALKFVQFMTSDTEQTTLNKAYSSLPTVQGAYGDPAFQTDTVAVLKQELATTAAPLPQVPQESQYETLVGTLMKNLFADAAGGKRITSDYVRSKLSEASQQVKAGG
jgi:multiple sugar transport system substrate-binding protein